METIWKSIRLSADELKNTVTVTTTAMLTGLYVVLHTFTTIVLNAFLQLRFSGMALALIGVLYGPVPAALAGGIGDLLKCVIRPTGAFFPGFTLSEIIRGFLFGLFFYRKKVTFRRALIASAVTCVICDLFLATFWLTIMGNGAFGALLVSRLLRCVLMIPVETVIIYGSLGAVKRVRTVSKR